MLRVANAALRFRAPIELAGKTPYAAPAGQKLQWVLRGGSPVVAAVTTGVSDGTLTEVPGGGLRPHRAAGAARSL